MFVTPETIIPDTLWREVVGEDSETTTQQRAAATRVESGSFAEGTLRLQIQPMRVDWFYEPPPATTAAMPAFGRFPAAARPFLEFVRRWATTGSFPTSTRIALGFTLIAATEGRATGYRELSEFIDGVPTPDATDFQYQVNRPRASRAGIEGLNINRLSRWSVGALGTVALLVGAGAPHPIIGPLQHHLRLEVDVNTAADFQGVIPHDMIPALLDDLFAGVTEVCEQGAHTPT